MFNKILVAIDHSAGSKQVFNQALSIAQANDANLILLHVLSTEEAGSPEMSPYLLQHKDRCIHVNPRIMRQANVVYDQEWSEFKQKGIKLLSFYTETGIAAGVKTEFTQIMGHPSSTICEFARSCHVDLIVIGRRGHLGFKEVFLGSVSNYVVHHAPCSILLVHTPIDTAS
ncbi:MAG: universal stress protein [Cyanobacteria bacterium P01_G01_bin.39]